MALVLELSFIDHRKSDRPDTPIAEIYVKTYTSNETGRVFISPKLRSPADVDQCIDSLISDLNEIRKKAKKNLGKYNLHVRTTRSLNMNNWPTLDELIVLNPRLQALGRKELSELISTIKSCGWKWNARLTQFVLPTLGTGINTQGLDLFTAQTFKQHHDFIVSAARSYPKEYSEYVYGMSLWQKSWPIFALSFLGVLIFGWAILEQLTWLVTLFILLFSIVAVYRFSRYLIAPYQAIEKRRLKESIMRNQNFPIS